MQTALVTKDKTFTLRLDEKDRERLEIIAAHMEVSAATAVRLLIKEKAELLAKQAAQTSTQKP